MPLPFRSISDVLLVRRAHRIREASERLASESDTHLRERFGYVSHSLLSGDFSIRHIDECFALTVEASARMLGKRHFPVQIMGGLSLLRRGIVEMQTGEGKTITAVLPVVARAFQGKGCHVVTSNDYLASRDAEELKPLYEFAGLTVGCVTSEMDTERRRDAYQCDVTYGTGSEFGFDFLRDRMQLGPDSTGTSTECVQRSHYFALIDEADSVLVDDARTPLIIGAEGHVDENLTKLLHWTSEVGDLLSPNIDYSFDERKKQVWLTPDGERTIALHAKPGFLNGFSNDQLLDRIENALTAKLAYQINRDYVIQDGQVVIVSESSGRSMAGRKWQQGLHQAVESKEGLEVTGEAGIASRITIQSYFRKYRWISGMTGTAITAKKEFKRFFRMHVLRIPTNRPCLRRNAGISVYANRVVKLEAIVEAASQLSSTGRAVLIGVPTIEESFMLAELFQDRGHDCPVLNAVRHELEAEIIAQAGQSGRITISTNMAGRGTDILLDEQAKSAGGLHVILTELHSSNRYDRQLLGRAARQGDPGSFEFIVSIEDSLLTTHAPRLAGQLKRRFGNSTQKLPDRIFRKMVRVQRRLEAKHSKDRKRAFEREQKLNQMLNRAGIDTQLEFLE